MTYDERNKQALFIINKIRTEIRRQVFIDEVRKENTSYEECYDIANNAAWNYVKCLCENNEVYDAIKQALDEMEANIIQYAYLAANGSNLAAD